MRGHPSHWAEQRSWFGAATHEPTSTAAIISAVVSAIATAAAVSLEVAPGRAINQVTVGANAPANAATGEVRIGDGIGPDDALDALDTIIARMTADRIGGPQALAIAQTLRARMVADRIQGTP